MGRRPHLLGPFSMGTAALARAQTAKQCRRRHILIARRTLSDRARPRRVSRLPALLSGMALGLWRESVRITPTSNSRDQVQIKRVRRPTTASIGAARRGWIDPLV